LGGGESETWREVTVPNRVTKRWREELDRRAAVLAGILHRHGTTQWALARPVRRAHQGGVSKNEAREER
jgi:hypothetical protein